MNRCTSAAAGPLDGLLAHCIHRAICCRVDFTTNLGKRRCRCRCAKSNEPPAVNAGSVPLEVQGNKRCASLLVMCWVLSAAPLLVPASYAVNLSNRYASDEVATDRIAGEPFCYKCHSSSPKYREKQYDNFTAVDTGWSRMDGEESTCEMVSLGQMIWALRASGIVSLLSTIAYIIVPLLAGIHGIGCHGCFRIDPSTSHPKGRLLHRNCVSP